MKIKKIISYMQEKDINPLKVDAWEDSRAEIYSALKRKYDEGKRDFKKDGHRILIEYTPSGGRGMGEYPPEMRISVLVDWNVGKVVNIQNVNTLNL